MSALFNPSWGNAHGALSILTESAGRFTNGDPSAGRPVKGKSSTGTVVVVVGATVVDVDGAVVDDAGELVAAEGLPTARDRAALPPPQAAAVRATAATKVIEPAARIEMASSPAEVPGGKLLREVRSL